MLSGRLLLFLLLLGACLFVHISANDTCARAGKSCAKTPCCGSLKCLCPNSKGKLQECRKAGQEAGRALAKAFCSGNFGKMADILRNLWGGSGKAETEKSQRGQKAKDEPKSGYWGTPYWKTGGLEDEEEEPPYRGTPYWKHRKNGK